jgi:hypothetical protein
MARIFPCSWDRLSPSAVLAAPAIQESRVPCGPGPRAKLFTLLLSALLGVACTSTGRLFPIGYDFVDLPGERRIEIRYRNQFVYAVCLLPEFWPNKAGKIDHASGEVFLVIAGRHFQIEEFNTGYCPDCPLRVEPGKEVRARIEYEAFAVPESLAGEEKRLQFAPRGYRCDPRE